MIIYIYIYKRRKNPQQSRLVARLELASLLPSLPQVKAS